MYMYMAQHYYTCTCIISLCSFVSRVLRVREDSPPSEMRYDTHTGLGGDFGPPRVSSGSSLSGHKGVPLNEHGMTMGKFCYECGSKYPVPQAKYCCECGTKRI